MYSINLLFSRDCSTISPSVGDGGDEEELQKLSALEKEFKASKEQSISSMLSEVSERVMERCGCQIEESSRTSFQDQLFYDQVSK